MNDGAKDRISSWSFATHHDTCWHDHLDCAAVLIAELTTQRDLAREVAVTLEQEVAVMTTERDGEIERLRVARQDAYDEVVTLRQEVEQLRSSWGFIRDGA